jgi:hypothetical protein
VTLRAGDETIRVPNSIIVERKVLIERGEQSSM